MLLKQYIILIYSLTAALETDETRRRSAGGTRPRARRARWARPTEVSTDAMGTVELRRGGGDGTVPGAVAGDDRRASPAAR